MPIAETGYWTTEDGKEHIHDGSLALSLVKFASMHRLTTVADFGCGLGNYVWHLTQFYNDRPTNINLRFIPLGGIRFLYVHNKQDEQ